MDLMSSLRLLCALAATLPALGISTVRRPEIKINNSLMINQKQPTHKILLNINGPPLVKVVTELQSVFRDIACRNCTTCMERAIKAHRVQSHVISNQPNAHELYYDVLNNNERKKRNTEVQTNRLEGKIEKGLSVMATVTKYTKERKVFAIEVKETSGNVRTNCKVYSVKKSLPCDASDIIFASKKNNNKKIKKIKDRIPVYTERVTVVTERAKSIPSMYKKREVDNSQVAESFMPSIEELY